MYIRKHNAAGSEVCRQSRCSLLISIKNDFTGWVSSQLENTNSLFQNMMYVTEHTLLIHFHNLSLIWIIMA